MCSRVFPKIVFCLTVVSGTTMLALLAEDLRQPDLPQLRKINSEAAAAVRTCVFRETVTDQFTRLPSGETLARDRLTDALTMQMERVLRQAAAQGSSDETLARIEGKHLQRLATLDGALRVQELNRAGVSRRRVSTIDFLAGKARHEEFDLRDLDALVENYALSPEERMALDKSGILVLRADEPGARLLPGAGLAVVGAAPPFCEADERRKLGLIPGWPFTTCYEVRLSSTNGAGARSTQMLGFHQGRLAFHVVVRSDVGYRVTQLTTFDQQGRVAEEFSATDYRKVDGIWVPFRTVRRWAQDGLADYWIQSRKVQSVQINPTLKETDYLFSIPETYRVRDITPGPPSRGPE